MMWGALPLLLLGIAIFRQASGQALDLWPEKVNCNRVSAEQQGGQMMSNFFVQFARPLENGDVITVEGYFPNPMQLDSASINFLQYHSYNYQSLHMRFDPSWIYFCSGKATFTADGQWAPQIYTGGVPFKLTVKKMSNYWSVLNNGVLVKNFPFAHPPDTAVNYFYGYWHLFITAIQVDCARPAG